LPVYTTLGDDDQFHTGLTAYKPTSKSVGVKSAGWTYTPFGVVEELYGNDWTKLTLLEPRPRLTLAPNPSMQDGARRRLTSSLDALCLLRFSQTSHDREAKSKAKFEEALMVMWELCGSWSVWEAEEFLNC